VCSSDLKEVHHRVKNNLQIVASLLSLQAGRSDDAHVLDILEDTRGRVKSMAQLHETLYCSENLAHIDFASYLRDLCHQLLASSGYVSERVNLEFRVAPVGLTLEPALPCGLIVNELVSNSLKHGFPGNRTGTITIGLEIEGDQTLVLSVHDNGTGLPPGFDPASRSTLGMRLVTGLVGQLNGQLRMERPHDGGAFFSVVFPIPERTKIGGES
jgi:two-component sensor histidine kinase